MKPIQAKVCRMVAGFLSEVMECRDGEGIRSFSGHTDDVSSVTFSPDGTKVLLVARLRHFGDAYGVKFLASSTLLFGFGIGEVIRRIHGRKAFVLAALVLSVLVLWQYIQVVEYKTVVSYDQFSAFSVPRLLTLFLEKQPSLLLRSNNLVSLFRLGVNPVSSWMLVYFVLFLPLFLLTVILCLIWKMNLLFELFKKKTIVLVLGSAFAVLALFLYLHDSFPAQTIEKRFTLVKEMKPKQSKLIQMRFGMQDYLLGIKAKDKLYHQIRNVQEKTYESSHLRLQ